MVAVLSWVPSSSSQVNFRSYVLGAVLREGPRASGAGVAVVDGDRVVHLVDRRVGEVYRGRARAVPDSGCAADRPRGVGPRRGVGQVGAVSTVQRLSRVQLYWEIPWAIDVGRDGGGDRVGDVVDRGGYRGRHLDRAGDLPGAIRALVLVDLDGVVGGAAVTREEVPGVGAHRLVDGPVIGPRKLCVRGLFDLQFEVVAERDVADGIR